MPLATLTFWNTSSIPGVNFTSFKPFKKFSFSTRPQFFHTVERENDVAENKKKRPLLSIAKTVSSRLANGPRRQFFSTTTAATSGGGGSVSKRMMIIVGIHLIEAPVLHPMSEGLFNFVIGWTFMFAPLLNTDKKRDRYKASLDALWGFQMFLTNTFLIPYMAIRLNEGQWKQHTQKELSTRFN